MKQNAILLPLLLLMAYSTIASDSTSVKKPYKRVYLAASFTPMVTYRYLTVPSGSNMFSTFERDFRNRHEKPEMGFNAGPRLGVNISRHVSFETGVDYYYHVYKFTSDDFRLDSSWDPRLFDTATTNNHEVVMKKYHYISVPVQFNFLFGKHAFKAIAAAGANINILAGAAERHHLFINGSYYSNTRTDTRAANGLFNISPFLGIGAQWNIAPWLFVRLMPYAQMQALNNTKSSGEEYLWGAGVNASLGIGFIKAK